MLCFNLIFILASKMTISEITLNFPGILTFMLVFAVLGGFSIIGLSIIKKFFHHSILKHHNDVAGFIFAVHGVIYAVLIGFVVVGVWEDYKQAENLASSETAKLLSLYNDIESYPNENVATELKKEYLKIVHAITTIDYPALKQGKESNEGAKEYLAFSTLLTKINPISQTEVIFFRKIVDVENELYSISIERYESSKSSIPSVLWWGIILGAFVTLGFSCIYGTENFWALISMNLMLSFVLSLLITIIIMLDSPFEGTVSVNPENLEHLLKLVI